MTTLPASRNMQTGGPSMPTVLVVDDDPRNLLALETVLEGGGFQLQKAQTAADALMALMTGDFAAIVLDVKMPDMSGIELARMIKQRKRTQQIPLIFLTAHFREDEHAVLGYDVGAVDYLTKPINPAVLRSKVSVFVDLYTKTRALEDMHRAAHEAEEALREANAQLAARNEALEREAQERERRLRAESAQAEAEKANAAKDRFLAMLSHELRTPLSPIAHAAALLDDFDCPPSVRAHIATIQRNVRLEARLIDDLLDLARIRNGKLRIETQEVDLHQSLVHALEICRPELQAGEFHVVERLEAGDPHVQGDPARLQQVFWNLLANAVKFSAEKRTIEVRTFAGPSADEVTVEIADCGVGIEPANLASIFNAFEQGARPQRSGLGLGLAICKALVELHGGKISAHSNGPNTGTRFSIRLPLMQSASQISPEAPLPDATHPGLRLLVVEDHKDTLATLENLLTRRGYLVRTAASIAESLDVASQFPFDVLISDIGLPDGRGTELLARLEAQQGSRPVSIAMSGYGMDEDIKRSRSAGFSEHLTKPVDFAALQRAILRITGPGSAPSS